MAARDMTVGELIAALQEFPDYYAVVPIINNTIGVVTGVRQHAVERQPVVLIGECDLNFNLVESLRTGGA